MSREKAFQDLMNAQEVIPPEEYPEVVTLPDYVQARTLEAVEGTADDNRERSLHFRWKCNRWKGGIAVRGSQVDRATLLETGTKLNFWHQNSTLIKPPHIHLHTHPYFDDEMVSEYVRNSVDVNELGEEVMEITKTRAIDLAHFQVRYPSTGDIYRTLKDPLASVAHLLATQIGNFLWVHRDLKVTKGAYKNTFTREYDWNLSEIRKIRDEMNDFEEQTIDSGLPINEICNKLLGNRINILGAMYVCYASRDFETPQLTRIN